MKGNQGLEALAALCGGASKARTEESGQKRAAVPAVPGTPAPANENRQPTMVPPNGPPLLPSPAEGAPAPAAPVPVDLAAFSPQWPTMAYGGMPNAAATTAAAAAILQAATTVQGNAPAPPPDPNNPFNAMQQVAYYQYLHAHAAAQAQAHAAQQHILGRDGKTATPASYIDPNGAPPAYHYPPTQLNQQQQQQQPIGKCSSYSRPTVPVGIP